MSRKDGSFRQLLEYVNRGAERDEVRFLWNLGANNDNDQLGRIQEQFEVNAAWRKARKNGVTLYHEVLSFAPEDAQSLTPVMIHDLAEAYLIRRAPNALAFGRIHWEENPHIHLVVSGNEVQSPTPTRISKGDFERVKRELEVYQRQRYPELRSLVFERERRKPKQRLAEAEQERRLKKSGQSAQASDKDRIAALVRQAFLESASEREWIKCLADHGLVFYRRGQDSHGLTDGTTSKKYRLKKLGLAEMLKEHREAWRRVDTEEMRKKQDFGLTDSVTGRNID